MCVRVCALNEQGAIRAHFLRENRRKTCSFIREKKKRRILTSRKEEDLSGIDIYRRSGRRWQIFTKFVSRNSPGAPFSTLIKKTFLDLGEWNNLFLPPLSLPILGERFPAHTTNSPRVNTKNLGDFGIWKGIRFIDCLLYIKTVH